MLLFKKRVKITPVDIGKLAGFWVEQEIAPNADSTRELIEELSAPHPWTLEKHLRLTFVLMSITELGFQKVYGTTPMWTAIHENIKNEWENFLLRRLQTHTGSPEQRTEKYFQFSDLMEEIIKETKESYINALQLGDLSIFGQKAWELVTGDRDAVGGLIVTSMATNCLKYLVETLETKYRLVETN